MFWSQVRDRYAPFESGIVVVVVVVVIIIITVFYYYYYYYYYDLGMKSGTARGKQ